jgi:hypothetical protein
MAMAVDSRTSCHGIQHASQRNQLGRRDQAHRHAARAETPRATHTVEVRCPIVLQRIGDDHSDPPTFRIQTLNAAPYNVTSRQWITTTHRSQALKQPCHPHAGSLKQQSTAIHPSSQPVS